ncbi:MAG: type III-B CRISPR module-associated protein Cmr5 [Candidatus Schekmanbacteria bacterium]|nr:type III-B CRISPR module-associated protein Cmr5 [Candidatus Schekmanbacteria bacterium]
MAMLDQERARLAFAHVQEVKNGNNEAGRRKYATMVHAMPALLRSAGLSQALHFVASRKDQNQLKLLEHLARQLARVDARIEDPATLLEAVRGAELRRYLHLTQEALACVTWYRRFVQGELKIEAGESDDGD